MKKPKVVKYRPCPKRYRLKQKEREGSDGSGRNQWSIPGVLQLSYCLAETDSEVKWIRI